MTTHPLFLLQPLEPAPPPPGGGGSGPNVPSQGAPASPGDSGHPPAAGGGWSGFVMLLPIVVLVVMMLTGNRSTQKKQKELESKLKKGDRVVTQSGLIGKIAELDPRYARIEIAPGVKVQMLKSAITGLDADDTTATKTKDDAAVPADKKS